MPTTKPVQYELLHYLKVFTTLIQVETFIQGIPSNPVKSSFDPFIYIAKQLKLKLTLSVHDLTMKTIYIFWNEVIPI